jgi:hypothetical protein
MPLDDPWIQTAKKLHADKGMVITDICKTLRISRPTLCRWLAVKPQPTSAAQIRADRRCWLSAAMALWLFRGLSLLRERQHQIAGRVVVAHYDLDARKPSISGQLGGALHCLKIVRHGTTPTPSVWPCVIMSGFPVPQEHLRLQ